MPVHHADVVGSLLAPPELAEVMSYAPVRRVSPAELKELQDRAIDDALAMQERFREHVIATWRESGGEPDGAARLPGLLAENGFVIRSATPHIFCLRPRDYMWQWPATFIETYLPRLIGMGRIDQQFAAEVRVDLARAEANPNAFMVTPLVLAALMTDLNCSCTALVTEKPSEK